MSNTQKLIVVIGATGYQGSSVAKHFLTLPGWRVRAVTRNPSSPAAQDLASAGAEVVQADLTDHNSLTAAFDGANSIFVNTDFWGKYRGLSAATEEERLTNGELSLQVEVEHGKNAAIAAAAVPTLERFVYSSLPPMKKASKGKYYRSHHWDSKATIVEYIETQQKALAKKTSYIYLGGYATNPLLNPRYIPFAKGYKLVTPFKEDFKMPIILQGESTGPFVQGLIENEEPGTKLLAYNESLPFTEIAQIWSQAFGESVDLVSISPEQMHIQSGVPWEVLEAALFIPEYGYMGGVDDYIEPSQLKVPVKTRSFREWVKEQNLAEIVNESKKELESVSQ